MTKKGKKEEPRGGRASEGMSSLPSREVESMSSLPSSEVEIVEPPSDIELALKVVQKSRGLGRRARDREAEGLKKRLLKKECNPEILVLFKELCRLVSRTTEEEGNCLLGCMVDGVGNRALSRFPPQTWNGRPLGLVQVVVPGGLDTTPTSHRKCIGQLITCYVKSLIYSFSTNGAGRRIEGYEADACLATCSLRAMYLDMEGARRTPPVIFELGGFFCDVLLPQLVEKDILRQEAAIATDPYGRQGFTELDEGARDLARSILDARGRLHYLFEAAPEAVKGAFKGDQAAAVPAAAAASAGFAASAAGVGEASEGEQFGGGSDNESMDLLMASLQPQQHPELSQTTRGKRPREEEEQEHNVEAAAAAAAMVSASDAEGEDGDNCGAERQQGVAAAAAAFEKGSDDDDTQPGLGHLEADAEGGGGAAKGGPPPAKRFRQEQSAGEKSELGAAGAANEDVMAPQQQQQQQQQQGVLSTWQPFAAASEDFKQLLREAVNAGMQQLGGGESSMSSEAMHATESAAQLLHPEGHDNSARLLSSLRALVVALAAEPCDADRSARLQESANSIAAAVAVVDQEAQRIFTLHRGRYVVEAAAAAAAAEGALEDRIVAIRSAGSAALRVMGLGASRARVEAELEGAELRKDEQDFLQSALVDIQAKVVQALAPQNACFDGDKAAVATAEQELVPQLAEAERIEKDLFDLFCAAPSDADEEAEHSMGQALSPALLRRILRAYHTDSTVKGLYDEWGANQANVERLRGQSVAACRRYNFSGKLLEACMAAVQAVVHRMELQLQRLDKAAAEALERHKAALEEALESELPASLASELEKLKEMRRRFTAQSRNLARSVKEAKDRSEGDCAAKLQDARKASEDFAGQLNNDISEAAERVRELAERCRAASVSVRADVLSEALARKAQEAQDWSLALANAGGADGTEACEMDVDSNEEGAMVVAGDSAAPPAAAAAGPTWLSRAPLLRRFARG